MAGGLGFAGSFLLQQFLQLHQFLHDLFQQMQVSRLDRDLLLVVVVMMVVVRWMMSHHPWYHHHHHCVMNTTATWPQQWRQKSARLSPVARGGGASLKAANPLSWESVTFPLCLDRGLDQVRWRHCSKHFIPTVSEIYGNFLTVARILTDISVTLCYKRSKIVYGFHSFQRKLVDTKVNTYTRGRSRNNLGEGHSQ